MVAITVVLAAVLYVMVSGLISGPGTTPRAMGGRGSRSGDGANWIMLVSSAPAGKAYAYTTLAIFKSDGSVNLTATFLSLLATATNGCSVSKGTASAVSAPGGDRS